MKLITRHTLQEISSVQDDARRISDLAFATVEHGYDPGLLERIRDRASALRPRPGQRFFGLLHMRQAHLEIPEIGELMFDRERLEGLSSIAAVRLEPYPITRAACHLNYYAPGRIPISFHTDGAAMVELVPLLVESQDECGGTLIYRGRPEEGESRLQKGEPLDESRFLTVPHIVGRSTLLQGRMLLHSASTVTRGERIILVLVLRSLDEPWKDDNSLMRLMMDDPLDAILEEWIHDVATRKLPTFKAMHAQRASR